MTTNQPANSAATTNEGDLTQQANVADATNIAADANANPSNEGTDPNAAKPQGDEGKKDGEGKADDKAKSDDEGKGDDKNKADDKSKQGAPEEYKDFALPEGNEVDAELMGEFKSIAKELNLTQEQAQRLAEIGGKIALKASGPGEEAIVAEAKNVWGKQTIADKEIGGDKLAENLSVAKKTLDTFGSPELKDLLNKSGMGNHPEVIRLFYKIGKQIGEDNVLVSGVRAPSAQNHADKLYGNSSKPSK